MGKETEKPESPWLIPLHLLLHVVLHPEVFLLLVYAIFHLRTRLFKLLVRLFADTQDFP